MQTALLTLALLILTTVGACSRAATEPSAAARPVQVEPPAEMISTRGTRVGTARPPSVVQLRGRQVLVYEIIVTPPPGAAPISIDRIEVLEGSGPFAAMDAAAIATHIAVRGPDHNKINPVPKTVAPGQEAIVFMFHEVPPARKLGDHLLANVSLRYGDGATELASLKVPILPVAAVVLGAPLRGGPWLAINGISNESHHRQVVPYFFAVPRLSERYAIDYIMLDETGKDAKLPNSKVNEDYYAYGKELLAVGDGTIRRALDGLPEISPGALPPTTTLATIIGNTISLELDGARGYVLYAHMKTGTLRVKVGDRVKKGDVLGLLGNSGNSSAPHLHIHVTDRPDPIESEGVPFVFESFSYVGDMFDDGAGGIWKPQASEPQKGVLPAENEGHTF